MSLLQMLSLGSVFTVVLAHSSLLLPVSRPVIVVPITPQYSIVKVLEGLKKDPSNQCQKTRGVTSH